MSLRRVRKRRLLLLIGILYAILVLIYGAFQLSIISSPATHTQSEVQLNIETKKDHSKGNIIVTEEDFTNWQRVVSLEELQGENFYRLRVLNDGRWLGHSSSGVYNNILERTIAILPGRTNEMYAIQAWSTFFLSAHNDKSVGMDRLTARSAEMWKFKFLSNNNNNNNNNNTAAIYSVSERCFIRVDGNRLRCDVKSINDAAKWEIYREPVDNCRMNTNSKDWDNLVRLCWGHTNSFKMNSNNKIVLFGTPKPLKSLKPNLDDTHDPFIILNRTLFNWVLIDNVQPIIFTDDPLSEELIKNINKENEMKGFKKRIEVIKKFEIHKKFGQPTYRGLFLSALSSFPEVKTFMYSNMDILFSSSTVDTINAIRNYHNVLKERNSAIKGWFAVGRRINVDIPINWSIDVNWENYIDNFFKKIGIPFQSLSEDYFAMSYDMFEWEEIPDFVVGGTAFDNWVTTKAVLLGRAGVSHTVEVSSTLTAIHQNHGENIKASHQHPKSRHNNLLAHRNGGWSLGRTTDPPLITINRFGEEVLVFDKLNILVD